MHLRHTLRVAAGLTALLLAAAAAAEPESPLDVGVAQLRHAIGRWDVVTTQFDPEGKILRTAPGSYRFEWAVPDRVVAGRSEIPELGNAAGILFYVRERRSTIEMVSVGADGHLWVMTGPVDGETRTTPATPLADGRTMTLRFTRYHVEPDRFESRMEISFDGGESWQPGNHQVFRRAAGD